MQLSQSQMAMHFFQNQNETSRDFYQCKHAVMLAEIPQHGINNWKILKIPAFTIVGEQMKWGMNLWNPQGLISLVSEFWIVVA